MPLDINSFEPLLLRVPSELMIYLTAVEYPVSVENGLIFMGFGTAAVPIQRLPSGEIIWAL